eukprot:5254663-Ditylum_brightwellii.AAC.1
MRLVVVGNAEVVSQLFHSSQEIVTVDTQGDWRKMKQVCFTLRYSTQFSVSCGGCAMLSCAVLSCDVLSCAVLCRA